MSKKLVKITQLHIFRWILIATNILTIFIVPEASGKGNSDVAINSAGLPTTSEKEPLHHHS